MDWYVCPLHSIPNDCFSVQHPLSVLSQPTEILKTLDKLEKGVEGDLSSLGRATRNLNRFRKRFPSTTWVRILHTIIPANYRQEFGELLSRFIADIPSQEIALISKLAGVSPEDATSKMKELNGDVFASVMAFIAEKEKMAKIEIKKKQDELKKEREARYEVVVHLMIPHYTTCPFLWSMAYDIGQCPMDSE